MTRTLRWQRLREDDQGSLALLMLAVILGMALSSLLVPVIVSQSAGARHTMAEVRALHAAEAGTDIALGQIRAAGTVTAGDTTKLPCAPISGPVSGDPGTTYSVTLLYFTVDPTGKSDSWLASNSMRCASGYGTYDPSVASSVPADALITSVGHTAAGSATADRTLRSTYVFKTTTATSNGGVVRIYPGTTAGAPQMCLDAGPSPASGTAIVLQACSTSTPPIAQQTFSYNTDLSLRLESSGAGYSPNGLCLDSAIPRAAGNAVVLRPCNALGSAPYNQQWSINDTSAIEGATSTRKLDSTSCFNVASQAEGTPVTLQASCSVGYDTSATWVPSPTVGAGMAGTANNQLVNLQQFGRCFDITDQSFASSFMIAYPCKQDPTPANVAFNQKFSYNTSTKRFSTTDTRGVTDCLTNPGTADSYVTFSPCTPASNQQWTTYGSTAADTATATQWPYLQRYTLVDSTGLLCLSLGATTDLYNGQYSKITVARCDGSSQQKWNAAANIQSSAVQNVVER